MTDSEYVFPARLDHVPERFRKQIFRQAFMVNYSMNRLRRYPPFYRFVVGLAPTLLRDAGPRRIKNAYKNRDCLGYTRAVLIAASAYYVVYRTGPVGGRSTLSPVERRHRWEYRYKQFAERLHKLLGMLTQLCAIDQLGFEDRPAPAHALDIPDDLNRF